MFIIGKVCMLLNPVYVFLCITILNVGKVLKHIVLYILRMYIRKCIVNLQYKVYLQNLLQIIL